MHLVTVIGAVVPAVRMSGPASGRCTVAPRPEASQRLSLVLEIRDDLQQVDDFEYDQDASVWTKQCQATTFAFDGNIRLHDCTYTGAIDLRQVGQVQQQIACAGGRQCLQMSPQPFAVSPDRRVAAKIEYGDTAGFSD